ncbi:lysis system i-spanin subunit Rz [Pseudomonas tussilaginis]|uniref:lysis system i-spanin subunit Rz n=1 Tax=Pseudomonas sp. 5 TaxID=1619949 RepID=UPI0005EB94C5|nr:lysis system i-spanin subunit Rz [Pseudomonas sp. 5]KJK05383.1 lysozyme [Pseudomonas sp. 5]
MMTLNCRLAALALLLGLALGGRVAWQWQANSYGKVLSDQARDHKTEREAAATAVIDWKAKEQTQRRALEDRLQANDETHYKELLDAQQTQARLRDRLATADLRLSVLLTPDAQGGGGGLSATTSTGGVVHGSARGELDPAHAQRIVAIAGDGDQGLTALAACQAYAREVRAGTPPILPATE